MRKYIFIIALLLISSNYSYAVSPGFLGMMSGDRTSRITSVVINNHGTGCTNQDVLSVAGGTGATVLAVLNGGYCGNVACPTQGECEDVEGCNDTWNACESCIAYVVLLTPGSGYSVSTQNATGGTCSNVTVDITGVE